MPKLRAAVRPRVSQQAGLELPVPRAQKARAKSNSDPSLADLLSSCRGGRPGPAGGQLVPSEDVGPSPSVGRSPEDLFAGIVPREEAAGIVKESDEPSPRRLPPPASVVPREEPAGIVKESDEATPRRLAQATRRAEVVIPASEFFTSTRVDGRPARQRFPVLERWRNETLVYERQKDSLCPSVKGVSIEERPPPTPRQRRAPTPAKARQPTPAPPKARRATPRSREEILRARSPAERVAAAAAASVLADEPPAEPAEPLPQAVAQPLCRRLWPEDQAPSVAEAPDEEEGQREQPEFRCPHCSRNDSSSVAKRRRPNADSLKSILRRRGEPRNTRSIGFSEDGPATVDIKNFGGDLANDLWYSGYAVECDRCEKHLDWGKEGSLVGGAGQSRFTQGQALCNACLAERLYGEIGVWLIVALAACGKKNGDEDGEKAQSRGAVAQGPIQQLLDALLRLSHSSKTDQLVALLGPEVAAPEVRSVVLQKARCGVGVLLGGKETVSPQRPADNSPARARSQLRLKARSRTLQPRGWKRRGMIEAACKRRKVNPQEGSGSHDLDNVVDPGHECTEPDAQSEDAL